MYDKYYSFPPASLNLRISSLLIGLFGALTDFEVLRETGLSSILRARRYLIEEEARSLLEPGFPFFVHADDLPVANTYPPVEKGLI